MKTPRKQNGKNTTRLPAQISILLIITTVIFTGCKIAAENKIMPETVETDPVRLNEDVEFIDSEAAATDQIMESMKDSTVQSDQTAIPCTTAPILTMDTTAYEHCCFGGDILNIQYDEISISGNGYEAVAQAVSEWNRQDIEQIESLKDYAGYTKELSSVVYCNRMDNSVISFNQQWHEQDGFIYYRGINFDVTSGKKLTLADMLTDEEGFYKKATEIAVEKLLEIPDADKLPSGYEADVTYEFTNGILDSENKWCLNAYGIVYSYRNFEDSVWHGYIPNHHEDIPKENDEQRTKGVSSLPGNLTVTIPYEDVAAYMKPAYCGIQDVGTAKFSVNETVRVNLSNKRFSEKPSNEKSSAADFTANDTVLITIDETEAEENEISIIINGRKETFETEAWLMDAYLLCQKNGSTYLLFDTSYADHDDTTYLYDITDGEISKNDELEFDCITKPVNTDSFILQGYMTVFGAHFCYATYMIDESTGKLIYPEKYYTDAKNRNITITLTRELPVVIYDEETTLPPGTPLQVTALDNGNGTAYFYELNYGLEGEFYYTKDDGIIHIDGLEESSYFDIEYGG